MFYIKDDILLIFFLLSSLLTSHDIKKKSLADVSKEGKCGVKTARWKETSAAALYTKSATTPVWVFRSSERKRDTGRRVV